MQEFYDITVAGVKRSLPVVPINENMSIAGFVIFGDTDVVEPCARALAEKLPPETEVLVTAEAKSIPLIYEMAKVMKMPAMSLLASRSRAICAIPSSPPLIPSPIWVRSRSWW